MLSKKFSFLVVLIFISSNIYSQQKLSLTINEAVQIGLKSSKSLHISEMKVKSSQAKSQEVNAAGLPSLKFNATYTRLSPIDPFSITTPFGSYEISPSILNNYQTKLTLMQPLFLGWKLSSSSEIAENNFNASMEDFNKDKSELIFNIKNSYWSLFKAIKFKKVIDDVVEQINAHLTDAKNLFKQGMLTDNDILKIEVQLSDSKYKQIEAKNNVKLAMIALNNIMSIPLNTEIEIVSAANYDTKFLVDIDELISKAINQRPEIKAANFRIKMGEAGITLAKSNWYPQVSLFGDYNYSNPNQRIFPSEEKFKGTWDVGVALSMDIWNWNTTGHQTEQAESQLNQANDVYSVTKDFITLEVTQNYFNLLQSKEKIHISDLAAKQAEENMRVTSEKFKNGVALSSDLIDAEVALLSAKTNYTTSVVDFELAKAKLDKSIGN